jgi:predicted Fe-S protein YdhL (DUF1289 family)
MTGYQSKKAMAQAKLITGEEHMTWVFLTNAERDKISHKAGPYIVNSYEPHEAAVRQRNHRDNWKGLTEEQRNAIATEIPKPFFVKDVFAAIEAKLREKNNG